MYKTKVHKQDDRGTIIEQLQDWVVPEEDTDLWGCSGQQDWPNEHSKKYFVGMNHKRIAIQAGGAFGIYPRMMAEMFERVYTFEIIPVSFHCLVQNCQKDNIIKMQAALGADHRLLNMNLGSPGNLGSTTVVTLNNGEDWVPQIPIDSLKLGNVDLIALDVEGYEKHVLDGARDTLQRCHPRVIMELGEGGQIQEIMESFGYRIIDHSGSDVIWN